MGETRFESFRDAAVDFQRPIRPADVGREATVTISRAGQGRVYYSARLFYAPAAPKAEPINAGIEVHREYSVQRGRGWLLLESPMDIRPGELVRVDLYLALPAARNFVVLDDPVPGGLEPVNRDLATASSVDAEQAAMFYAGGSFWFRHNDWWEYGYSRWSFYHRELRHQAVRFYSEYLPAGRYHLAYVAQAIAAGEFAVPPAHAEEMYNPDTFGQGVPAVLRVVREGQQEVQQ
jgi:alpha-2-macroglobulin